MALKPWAITNYRVSSDEQLLNNSLARQEKACLKTVEALGAEVFRSWSGSVSSKKGANLLRIDLAQMLEACKRYPRIKYAVFDELDRFMRSMLETAYFIVEFQKLGVKVIFASQPDLKTDTSTDTLKLMLEAYKSEGSNEERQRKSISGNKDALLEGRWPFCPKPGYRRGYERGVPEIYAPHGYPLRDIMLEVIAKKLSPTSALPKYNEVRIKVGLRPIKMDKFRKILTDEFYASIIHVDKQIKVHNENGLHEPLLTREQHYALVKLMEDKKKNQKGPNINGNPKYPLSNLITCDLCIGKKNSRFAGLDLNNGKNKSVVYEKYRCRSCNRSIPRDVVHADVINWFRENSISAEGKKELMRSLDIVWSQRAGEAELEAKRLSNKISHIESTIIQQVEAATDPANAPIKTEILLAIQKKKNEVSELQEKIEKLNIESANDKREFLSFALAFIEDTGTKFLEESLSRENRAKCKDLIFPAGFHVDAKNKVYTPKMSFLYSLTTNKKDTSVSEKSHVVRVRGL